MCQKFIEKHVDRFNKMPESYRRLYQKRVNEIHNDPYKAFFYHYIIMPALTFPITVMAYAELYATAGIGIMVLVYFTFVYFQNE